MSKTISSCIAVFFFFFCSHTFPDRARSIDRRRKDRRVETADDNGNREHCVRSRADTRIPPNPCGRAAAPVPSSLDTGTRVGISGSTFCLPARTAVAIRPTVPQHTDSATGPPKEAEGPRSSRWRLGMPSSLEIASPVDETRVKIFLLNRVRKTQYIMIDEWGEYTRNVIARIVLDIPRLKIRFYIRAEVFVIRAHRGR